MTAVVLPWQLLVWHYWWISLCAVGDKTRLLVWLLKNGRVELIVVKVLEHLLVRGFPLVLIVEGADELVGLGICFFLDGQRGFKKRVIFGCISIDHWWFSSVLWNRCLLQCWEIGHVRVEHAFPTGKLSNLNLRFSSRLLHHWVVEYGLVLLEVSDVRLHLLQEDKTEGKEWLGVKVILHWVGALDEIEVQMNVNLWLFSVSMVAFDKVWISLDQVIDKVTQEEHNLLVSFLLSWHLVKQTLVLCSDLIKLRLGFLLLALVIKDSFLEELSQIILWLGFLFLLNDWVVIVMIHHPLVDFFLQHLDVCFILLNYSWTEVRTLGKFMLDLFVFIQLDLEDSHLLFHLVVLEGKLFSMLGLVFKFRCQLNVLLNCQLGCSLQLLFVHRQHLNFDVTDVEQHFLSKLVDCDCSLFLDVLKFTTVLVA